VVACQGAVGCLAQDLSCHVMAWCNVLGHFPNPTPTPFPPPPFFGHWMRSGSMEPGFQRGDILFLENNTKDITIGDVVVFKIKGRDIPIVHRVLSKYKRCRGLCGCAVYVACVPCAGVCWVVVCSPYVVWCGLCPPLRAFLSLSPPRRNDGELEALTKGDNNAVDDRGLYADGQHYLARSDIVGRAR
jgi:signal peptidase